MQKCQSIGADLPIINSAEENTSVRNLLNAQGSKQAWIGLRRNVTDSKFYWVNGSPIEGNYESWKPGEPNNNRGEENCVHAIRKGWNDISCESHGAAVLCQKAMLDS